MTADGESPSQQEIGASNKAADDISSCDYLVIGAGATGMAFCDTLLHHASPSAAPSVVLVDKHICPGGQWNDSYNFVALHQPSKGYGVESERLEPSGDPNADTHRATRQEILDYYSNVRKKLESQYNFRFVGSTWFDMNQLGGESISVKDGLYQLKSLSTEGTSSTSFSVRVRKKVVDARYLEPDLPVNVAPKFTFNNSAIRCIPVNELPVAATPGKHYVVIGGGKTGMDAITYLQTEAKVDPTNIIWVVPNDAWITARENIGSCMEFLHTCAQLAKAQSSDTAALKQAVLSNDFFQKGFLEWEKTGRVYRLNKDVLPTKFKDATLCKREMDIIQKVTNVISHHGRVKSISDNGDMSFEDGTVMSLPDGRRAADTIFVHCSAGAFNYSKHPNKSPPVYGDKVLTIQDVYGTPGFCFVGSLFGRLEALGDKLSDAEKNAMCVAPQADPSQTVPPLGPSGGDIGTISKDHGLVQRVRNLERWLSVPEIKKWLEGHRLFNLGHLDGQQMVGLAEQIMEVLLDAGLVDA